nr:cytochrome b [Linognathus vituli]
MYSVKYFKITSLVAKGLFMLPTPSSLTYMWNMGALLGSCLFVQLVSGVFLSFHYSASVDHAFDSIVSLMNDVNWGWLIRFFHANSASLFFILIYTHIGRGLYFGSYKLMGTWLTGLLMLVLLMASAFLGYVLPWGQMSFWGATVITNLFSVIPFLGQDLVQTIWGGFSVGGPTLNRMYSIHFMLPFMILALSMIHIMSLHSTGSSNPLGLGYDYDKISFHPFYMYKDMLSVVLLWLMFMLILFQNPDLLMDPDNFTSANPMNTPPHIQPEWYFLFAYSILRSVPSKLGGVIALLMSVMILAILPLSDGLSGTFNPVVKLASSLQWMNFMALTWLGSMPVEPPFVGLGKVLSLLYFTTFILWGLYSDKTGS